MNTTHIDFAFEDVGASDDLASIKSALYIICSEFGIVSRLDVLSARKDAPAGDIAIIFDTDYVPGRRLLKQLVAPIYSSEIDYLADEFRELVVEKKHGSSMSKNHRFDVLPDQFGGEDRRCSTRPLISFSSVHTDKDIHCPQALFINGSMDSGEGNHFTGLFVQGSMCLGANSAIAPTVRADPSLAQADFNDLHGAISQWDILGRRFGRRMVKLTLVVFLTSFGMNGRLFPLKYLLRILCVTQSFALVFFWLQPIGFPYDIANHANDLAIMGYVLIFVALYCLGSQYRTGSGNKLARATHPY